MCDRDTLRAFARSERVNPDMFELAEADRREAIMEQSINEMEHAFQITGDGSPWTGEASGGKFLFALFDLYFKGLGMANTMTKTTFDVLVPYMDRQAVPAEVIDKLDAIVAVAESSVY